MRLVQRIPAKAVPITGNSLDQLPLYPSPPASPDPQQCISGGTSSLAWQFGILWGHFRSGSGHLIIWGSAVKKLKEYSKAACHGAKPRQKYRHAYSGSRGTFQSGSLG